MTSDRSVDRIQNLIPHLYKVSYPRLYRKDPTEFPRFDFIFIEEALLIESDPVGGIWVSESQGRSSDLVQPHH